MAVEWLADIYQGSVRVASLNKPVLLVGRESMNRSVDGDMVVVEIFPKDQWKAPGEEVLDQDRRSQLHYTIKARPLINSGSAG